MPALNAAATLRDSLDSLVSQTFRDFEIVLVDDGSTDDTIGIALGFRDSRIRILRQDARGLVVALNNGLSQCRGSFIARADADDINEVDRLKLQLSALRARNNLSGIGADLRLFGAAHGRWFFPRDPEETAAAMIFNSSLAHPAMLLRRKVLEGGYPIGYPHAEDYALWRELMGRGGRFASLPLPLVRHRVHSDQVTKRRRRAHLHSADRVRWMWLRQLGLSPSRREFDVHCGRGRGEAFVRETGSWFGTLEEMNRSKHLFDASAFSRVLGRRWLAICIANRQLGFKAWRRYWRGRWAGKGASLMMQQYGSAAWGLIWR